MYDEMIDSREGWTEAEEMEYNEYLMELERAEYERDLILEQQELEDFDEADEAYGYFGGDEYVWDCDFGWDG